MQRSRRARHGRFLLAACASLSELAVAQEPEPGPAPPESAGVIAAEDDWIGGTLSSRYRGRFTAGEQDHDLVTLITLDLGDEERHPWIGHVALEGSADLDGRSGSSSPVFTGLSDTYDGALTGRVHEAWAQGQDLGVIESARLGRQLHYETPELAWFDGAWLESRAHGSLRTRFGAWGGAAVHPYESSASGDAVWGAFVELEPTCAGRARVDWFHAADDARLGTHEDDLFALDRRQRLGERLTLEGGYSRLESQDRDVRLRASWDDPEADFSLHARWYRLLDTQNDLALEFDPFTTVLLEQFPYAQASLFASKGLGEKLRLAGGVDVRRVDDDQDIGQFNRDFERWFLTATLERVLPRALVASVTAERWDGGEDRIATWGAELSREWSPGWKAAVGSYYSLFKYDLLQLQERDEVRTYYARLARKIGGATRVEARYELEDDDATYHTLRLGVTWTF